MPLSGITGSRKILRMESPVKVKRTTPELKKTTIFHIIGKLVLEQVIRHKSESSIMKFSVILDKVYF